MEKTCGDGITMPDLRICFLEACNSNSNINPSYLNRIFFTGFDDLYAVELKVDDLYIAGLRVNPFAIDEIISNYYRLGWMSGEDWRAMWSGLSE